MWERIRSRPFAGWVIFLGLLYFGLILLYMIVSFLVTNPAVVLSNPIGLTFLLFLALFLATAFLSLRGKRWSFALAAGVSVLFLVVFGSLVAGVLVNPADPDFPLAISGLPALVLVATFSILSLVRERRGVTQFPYLASPKSAGGLLTVAVVGFVIGGLVVGSFGATIINRLLTAGCGTADVTIVTGAMAGPVGGVAEPFSPATLTVAAGASVTWCNGDRIQHTVTSNTTRLFDSGYLDPGVRWSHTFAQPGTYEYHCTPHSLTMWGKIIVTP